MSYLLNSVEKIGFIILNSGFIFLEACFAATKLFGARNFSYG